MAFNDLLAALRNPGDDGLPDTIYDDIEGAYNEDIGIRDAAIAERDAAIAGHAEELQGRDSEISRLKAVNYDLLMQSQTGDSESDSEGVEGGADTESDASSGGIGSLFEREVG